MNKTKFQNILYPVSLGIFAALLLQSGILHKLFGIKVMQLPYPITVLSAFCENIGKIICSCQTYGPFLLKNFFNVFCEVYVFIVVVVVLWVVWKSR